MRSACGRRCDLYATELLEPVLRHVEEGTAPDCFGTPASIIEQMSPGDATFQRIDASLGGRLQSLRRIVNARLVRRFNLYMDEIAAKYGGYENCNVRLLLHGTSARNARSIARKGAL